MAQSSTQVLRSAATKAVSSASDNSFICEIVFKGVSRILLISLKPSVLNELNMKDATFVAVNL